MIRACGVASSGFASRVLGRLTWMPVCRIGAVIIKITSNTSITSTSGVTLISANAVRVRPLRTLLLLLNAITLNRLALDEVEQSERKAVHLSRQNFDAVQVAVVTQDRRHRRRDAGRRRDQRLGDARRHGLDRSRRLLGQSVERDDDAHDRAEQPDERGRAGDRRKPAEAPFQPGRLADGGALHRPMNRVQIKPRLLLKLAVGGQEDGRQRARAERGYVRVKLGPTRTPLEGAQKLRALPLGPLGTAGLNQNDCPGGNGK